MIKGVGEKGFTLIEIIVSIAIIGILLMILLTFMTGSFQLIHRQGDRTDLLYAAQEELEKAIGNPDYRSQDERLRIENNSSSASIENADNISGRLIEIIDGKDKVILSHFIPDDL